MLLISPPSVNEWENSVKSFTFKFLTEISNGAITDFNVFFRILATLAQWNFLKHAVLSVWLPQKTMCLIVTNYEQRRH